MLLRNHAFGHYDMLAGGSSRIEHLGDKSTIPSDELACGCLMGL